MSNIAVNTFAMKAVVVGTGSLREFQQIGMAGQAYRSWPEPTAPRRADVLALGEIHERVADGRSRLVAENRRPRVSSSAVPARV